MKKYFILLIILLPFITSCSNRTDHKDSIIFVSGTEPESLDPAVITGLSEGRLVSMIFEGLTVYNPETLKPEPGAAETWTISPDKRKYNSGVREIVARYNALRR